MSENNIDPIRVAVAVVIVLCMASLGLVGYKKFADASASTATADSQSLEQIQRQLTDMGKRLEDLEKRRRTEPAKTAIDPTTQKTDQSDSPRIVRTQYQISPASAAPQQAASVQAGKSGIASAAEVAQLQQTVGALQEETTSNREAWQANTNRLADVAGELGTQHGQIIQNQDELKQFLARAEHHAFTFELRRGSNPAPVGPVRLALQTSNQKSRRYTLCVYLHDSTCIQVKDRVLYEVVQLAVAPDTAPMELIATQVGKDGIVGYLEVSSVNAGR